MKREMAVEDPVAGSSWHERQCERASGVHQVRVRQLLHPWRERPVLVPHSAGLDAVVKAVQMHRMLERDRVDYAEMNRVALSQRQSFSERPSLTVDYRHVFKWPIGIR